jgi:hypothetical protein
VFSAITENGAHIAASNSSELYTGYVNVQFTLPSPKTYLSTFIVHTDLGEIKNNEFSTIIDAIIDANPLTTVGIE